MQILNQLYANSKPITARIVMCIFLRLARIFFEFIYSISSGHPLGYDSSGLVKAKLSKVLHYIVTFIIFLFLDSFWKPRQKKCNKKSLRKYNSRKPSILTGLI